MERLPRKASRTLRVLQDSGRWVDRGTLVATAGLSDQGELDQALVLIGLRGIRVEMAEDTGTMYFRLGSSVWPDR